MASRYFWNVESSLTSGNKLWKQHKNVDRLDNEEKFNYI